MTVRTRFSPSPTGLLHLGNVRAALFSDLYAKKCKGKFLLRIEDTDATRSEEKYDAMLQKDLQWLGLHWQEGPFYQSKRGDVYREFYQRLEDQGKVFPCFCTDQELALNRKLQLSRGKAPRYLGTCRKLSAEDIEKKLAQGLKPALRFQVPENMLIEFTDLVKGPQKFNTDDIGDFIIRRADGSSSFLFSNAIDDSMMEVTHVLRGDDHLANTPRQLLLLKTLNMRTPEYGHLSLILGDDGSPLSKRHGSFSLHDLHSQGYLPLAVLNYLARLSHAYEENKLFSFDELAEKFSLDKISRAPARFDKNQLLHWQKEAVMQLDSTAAAKWLNIEVPADKQALFIDVMRHNVLFPGEAEHWKNILFGEDLSFNEEQMKVLNEAGKRFFEIAASESELDKLLKKLKEELNVSGKKLFMPVRVALTGETHGPELPQIAALLGREKMRERFERACHARHEQSE